MDWSGIVGAAVGGLVGGLAGYVLSIKSKPSFRYIGIAGNLVGASQPFSVVSPQALQCSARFEVSYRWRLGERFVARNSRGWIAIYDSNGNRVHSSPGVWAWGYAAGMDVIGEESLALFHIYPAIGSPSDPALIVIPSPQPQVSVWQPYMSFQCLDYGHLAKNLAENPQYRQLSSLCKIEAGPGFMLEVRVASENAHGARVKIGLGDALNKCLSSLRNNGRPMP